MAGIIKAWWHTQTVVAAFFERDVEVIPPMSVESEGASMPLKLRHATGMEFAAYSSYYIDNETIHFFLSRENFSNVFRHNHADYYICGNFNDWYEAIGLPQWKMRPSEGEFDYELSVPLALLGDRRRKFLFKFADAEGRWLQPRLDAPNLEYDETGNLNLRFFAYRSHKHIVFGECEYPTDLREPSFLRREHSDDRVRIEAAQLLLELNYGCKMGAHVDANGTDFALFAPRAELVKLVLRDSINSAPREIPMRSDDGAFWYEHFDENLAGKLYTYRVFGKNADASTAFDHNREIVDPYAKSLLRNSGPALILDSRKEPKAKRHFTPPHWHDLVIMEAHVRDLLAKAPTSILSDKERLGFTGLAKWLRSGDCYLSKTGANCIELQPIQEFDNEKYADYHWGYMPVNWFSPSSAYAQSPEEFSQNAEFADLVDAFHEQGLALILDVVYNHVGEPNHLIGIDKEYFFEITPDGNLTNFSGTGNDFRANAPMSKRLIIDSLKHLVETYNVDGFRFDLAELLGAEVLYEIEVELKKIKPAIILIAEPWSFRGNIAAALREGGFAYWNDGFREFMLEYALGGGNFDGFKYFVSGSQNWYASWPAQTVNYVESHDDMCLLDRISGNPNNPSVAEIRIYKIAQALTLLSVGIPMIAEGADLLRTKQGVNNTYLRGDLNALDYSRGDEYSGLRAWVRGLAKFRISDAAKALRLSQSVAESYCKFFAAKDSNAAGVLFNAEKSHKVPRVFAAFNPSANGVRLAIDDLDLSGFSQIADIDRFEPDGLREETFTSHGFVNLPPRSFALFVEK